MILLLFQLSSGKYNTMYMEVNVILVTIVSFTQWGANISLLTTGFLSEYLAIDREWSRGMPATSGGGGGSSSGMKGYKEVCLSLPQSPPFFLL